MRNTIQRHYLLTFLLSILFMTAACIDEGQVVRNCSVVTPSSYNPVILTPPASDTINEGSTATLSVVATAPRGSTLTYQWQKATRGSTDFTDIAGATATSYTTPALSLADSGVQYCVVVTATLGTQTSSVTSDAAILSVLTSAIIVWTHIDGSKRRARVPADGILMNTTLTATATDIKSVDTIPNSVTRIEEAAFEGCSGLRSITLPNSVTSIGSRAFYYCSGLESIMLPGSVTTIEEMAFSFCTGLRSITLPNSVTSIALQTFAGCSGLERITLPSSVTTIGDAAFDGCSSLERITLPNSVTTIGDWAFSFCTGLKSVTIPNGVTSIARSTFYSCSGLESVTLPNSVTTIGDEAFGRCGGLDSITLPNGVTTIGYAAFSSCSGLDSITLPSSVTTIGVKAFSGCSGLAIVRVEATTPPIALYAVAPWGALENTVSTLSITVPSASVNEYKGAEGWKDYANQITGY